MAVAFPGVKTSKTSFKKWTATEAPSTPTTSVVPLPNTLVWTKTPQTPLNGPGQWNVVFVRLWYMWVHVGTCVYMCGCYCFYEQLVASYYETTCLDHLGCFIDTSMRLHRFHWCWTTRVWRCFFQTLFTLFDMMQVPMEHAILHVVVHEQCA